MANLDINELSLITKLVPRFSGRYDELNNFITNLEIVNATIPSEKSTSFFNFIFKSRLDLRVQNRVKQISLPTTISQLITNLRATYKTLKTSNSILNELNQTTEKDNNVLGFATKIENLITELNEIQIAEEGEENRNTIINTNNKIAFNAFMNGLKNQQIITTIDASQVKTFTGAVKIAEQVSSRTIQKQVFHQIAHGYQRQRCDKCGGNHSGRCPANGVQCHKCGKYNHFSKMCFSRVPQNNRPNNNNGPSSINNNNQRNYNQRTNDPRNNHQRQWNDNQRRGSNNNNNNRNRNVNQIQDQGNSEIPEITQMSSPMGTQ